MFDISWSFFLSKFAFIMSNFNFFILSNSIVSTVLSKYLKIKNKNHIIMIVIIIIAIFILKARSIQEKISQTIDQIQAWILYFDMREAYSEGVEMLKI